jgi:hypothetical protein
VKRTADASPSPQPFPAQPGPPQNEPLNAPRSGALGTTEELSPPDPRTGCPRWPHGLLLRWQRGGQSGFVEGACHATNQCDHCAKFAARENAQMLELEAELGTAPNLLAILGTRTVTTDNRLFYKAREKLMLALRRRWPEAQYASLLEFTTGHAERSGGLRRPHWNLFLKGIPDEDADQVRELVRRIWCQHVDAEPAAQYVEVVRDGRAAARYVALHFQKESQAPPAGWRGQRFNASRHFFDGRTRAEMRVLAREAQLVARLRWTLLNSSIAWIFRTDPDLLGRLIEARLAERAATEWELLAVSPLKVEALLSMDPETGEILKRAAHPPTRRIDRAGV